MPAPSTRPFASHFARLRSIWTHEIWLASSLRDRSPRGRLYSVLRVLSITILGLRDLKVAARAAALSYSSLLGLGPLVAIAVLISGFALGNRDSALAAQSVSRVIRVIAPQIDQLERARAGDRSEKPPEIRAKPPTPDEARAAANPDLVRLIDNFIASSRSGTAGAIGLLTLLVIVIQLFTTIENTFNDIWGVRRGRSWLTRIIYYWTTVTLGALLFFASVTLLSAGAFIKVFKSMTEGVPFGDQLLHLFAWVLPSSSLVLMMLLLMLFYRTVPNTRVRWQAALYGAIIVTGLLFLNNFLAFLYFRGVLRTNSLYGSVGIVPILMVGLYVFWFFVLVGGQITYAIQNVHYRSSQAAWHSLNATTRESLSLLLLLLIARRFRECLPAYSTTELSHRIRVPAQVLNESLNRLCDLGLISQLPSDDTRDQSDYRYQPARPLDRISLVDFHRMFENYGEAPSGEMLDNLDPILAYYHERIAAALPEAFGTKSLNQLMSEFSPSVTTSPFSAPATAEEEA